MNETKTYQDLFKNTLFPIVVFDLDGNIVDGNNASEKLFGKERDELIGRNYSDLAKNPEEFLNLLRDHKEKILNKQVAEPIEFKLKQHDDKEAWLCLQFSLAEIEGKKQILTILQDITRRKRVERELEKERHTLNKMIELNPYAIALVDSDGYYISSNQAHLDMFKIAPPDDYSIFTDPLLIKLGIMPDGEIKLRRGLSIRVSDFPYNPIEANPKGKNVSVWIRATVFPIMDPNGDLEYAVVLYADVTKEKESEFKLKQLNKELEEKVKERTQELKESNFKFQKAYEETTFYKELTTHDIGNIIQTISQSVELLKEHDQSLGSEDIGEIYDLIERQANRGKQLIKNVKDLSLAEDSTILIEAKPLLKYVREAIDFVETHFRNKAIIINLSCKMDEVSVKGNDLLLDVFENILTNAIEYNEQSPIKIQINISRLVKNNEKMIKIEMKDNGIGIDDNLKSEIFEKSKLYSRRKMGRGIGLSLVSKIIKSYDGKIWVENRKEGNSSLGSNFVILLHEAE